MRNCAYCHGILGCTFNSISMKQSDQSGQILVERVPFESEEARDLCPSCHVTNNRYHHVNCPTEECLQCARRLKTCECVVYCMTISSDFATGMNYLSSEKQLELYRQIGSAIKEKTGFFSSKPDFQIWLNLNTHVKVKHFEPSHTEDYTLICQEYNIKPARC